MLGGTKFLETKSQENKNDDSQVLFECGVTALNFDRPLEAARFFSMSKKEHNAAYHFNLALCYKKCEDYNTAVLHLEKALSVLKHCAEKETQSGSFLPLLKYEENTAGYLYPMLYTTAEKLPFLAREQILRCLVDVLFALGNKEEMVRIAGGLKNKNYKNVKEKLSAH